MATDLSRKIVTPIPKPTRRKKQQRRGKSLSQWRHKVLSRDGRRCRSCGYSGPNTGSHLSAHHLIFRSHCEDQYVDDPSNGLTLCNEWGNQCHQKVHAGQLKIRKSWLPRSVRDCLKEQGLTWNEDGEPVGPCSRYFAKEAASGG